MKLTVFTLLLFCFVSSKGQEIEKYYDYLWKECEPNEARFYSAIIKRDSGYIRYDYFIHEKALQMSGKYNDADTKIPNGYFNYFHANGTLDGFGKYVEGKKDGLWIHYHANGMLKDSFAYLNGNFVGTNLSWHPNGYIRDSTTIHEDGSGVRVTWFDNGYISSAGLFNNKTKSNGKWKYYHKNGQVSSYETYDNGLLVDKIYFDESGTSIDTTNTDRDAMFPGGANAWQKYLYKRIYFPEKFKLVNGDKAVVVVSFAINEEGKLEDIFVSTPFYPEFDKIAKSAMDNSPKWLPAINHNRKAKSWIRQPITFSQSD